VKTPKIMDTSVYFEKISEEITKHLEAATHEIVIAVAWFTDASLFNILRRKASAGVTINLLYLDDKINNKASFNIGQLEAYKARLFPISSDMQPNNIMHNKFCVIDGKHVITGSYNWTNRAKSNDENITVFLDNPEISTHFLKAFDDLLEKYNYKKSATISPQAITPRLEVIKNFVLMEEWDAAQTQLEKLRSFTEIWSLDPLFSAMEKQDCQIISEWITGFIKDNMALVLHEDEDVIRLKIELRMIEYKVAARSAEKDGLEKQIADFHQRTNQELGELTAKYLKLQAALKQKEADESPPEPSEKERRETEAEEARDEYEGYQKDSEKLKQKPRSLELSDDEQQLLKKLYRKASLLCHPDRVSESQREVAVKQFIKLQTAYERNDLETVKIIQDDLSNNRPYTDSADTLSDSQSIKQETLRLESTSDGLLIEIFALKKQIFDLGIDDIVDLDEYFSTQKQSLMDAIEKLEMELPHV
jgi:hypothetical protein